MYLGTVIRHLSTPTEVLLPSSENHFSSPGRVVLSSLFWQCFGIPPSTFRRHKQSSWVHHFCLWIGQTCSCRRQPGQATHKSHFRFLNQDSSRVRVCIVSCKNSRTRIATPFVSANDAWFTLRWIPFGCVKMILMNLFLRKRMNWWKDLFPMKNRAAPSKKCGSSLKPLSEYHLVHRDTSWQKRPWGTKPHLKWRYSGHGSEGERSISEKNSGGVFSWQGTKYISFVGDVINLTINPNCSIMFKIFSLITPCCWQHLENTWSTSSMSRAPVASISFHNWECLGS